MESIRPSDLKTVLHSKRANIYYLEHCRVLVNGGRVEYLTDEGKHSAYWNIPIANTTTLLLGTGTSITQAAIRELSKAGVMVGFCGGGGTPLYGSTEVAWFSPQSEYRPTKYLQAWVKWWFDESERLSAAKKLQRARLERVKHYWTTNHRLRAAGFDVDSASVDVLITRSHEDIDQAETNVKLLTAEARYSKDLFRLISHAVGYGEFTRAKRGKGIDAANRYLDHGNYLAYGLGATATWVLGLPHGLAVLHGKTRRGGLVFDAADLVKDAVIMPQAFLSAMHGDSQQEFRNACVEALVRTESLDFMIGILQEIAAETGRGTP